MDLSDMTVNEIRLRMYSLLTQDEYMKPLLDLAFKYLNNPIMIADHTQHLIDYRQTNTVSSQKWQSVIDTGEYDLTFIDSAFFMNYAQVTQTRESLGFEVDGYPYYQCSIICHNIFLGSVCLLQHDHPVDEKDLVVLKTLAEIISVKMEPTTKFANELERQFGQILVNLLDGRIKRMSDLRYRMKTRNWEEKEMYTVALFRTREKGKALNKHIRQGFAKLHPGFKCVVYEGYLLVLLEQNNIVDKIYMDFREFCLRYNLRVGISESFNNLMDISNYYVQAQKALEFSYHMKEVKTVARYCDYIVEDIAQRLSMTDANKLLYHPAVVAMNEYDQMHKTSFSETFYTYIEQNRSITKTSQKLFQHKNTINYRIQRIRKLLDLDLDNFNELLHIYMTFKIMDVNKRQNIIENADS